MEKDQDITVIQVYAPTNNAEEDEVEWFFLSCCYWILWDTMFFPDDSLGLTFVYRSN